MGLSINTPAPDSSSSFLVLNPQSTATISSPVFLWASMTYLERGNFVKNILFTAIVMAFVILVFKVGFHVVLP